MKGMILAYKKKTAAGTFSYTVRNKNLLPKPLYFTFDDEREGDLYVEKLEKLLSAGILPKELVDNSESKSQNLESVIRKYLLTVAVPDSDQKLLNHLIDKIGSTLVSRVDYTWAENWVNVFKQNKKSPSTIRHNVGALARCLDWYLSRDTSVMTSNPLRKLPKRYATYRDSTDSVKDISRDRRVSLDEERLVTEIINGRVVGDHQRSIKAENPESLKLIFNLALETAMRLREIYTLTRSQINIPKRTIFLEKTKNGDKRQVPLSSVALKLFEEYGVVGEYDSKEDHLLFPYLKFKSEGDWTKGELKKVTDLLSSQFKRIFEYGGFGDLNFHDTRHEATSRLFEKTELNVLEIAKITGHKDLRSLMRYANLRGSDLASKLW